MIDVFISYAREDEQIATSFFNYLARNGYRPWMDKKNLIPGQDWAMELEKAVHNSDVQLFLCSQRSVGKRGFFQREIRLALSAAQGLLESDISVIPVRLDDCEIPDSLRKYQWFEYKDQSSLNKLLVSLSKACEQRDIFSQEASSKPVVVGFFEQVDINSERAIETSISVPEFVFSGDAELSKTINSVILGGAISAKDEFRNCYVDDEYAIERGKRNLYESHSEVAFLSERVISLLSMTYTDTGGAHGNGYRATLNVDIADRSVFKMGQLFESLEDVEMLLVDEMTKRGDAIIDRSDVADVVRQALNRKSLFSESGVSILFDQYEVFCYAAGPFSLDVSFENRLFRRENLTKLGVRMLG